MYTYDQIFEESFYSAKQFDFYYKDSDIAGEENARIGVFDIETTGLDPRNCQVIMGALLTRVDGGLRVRQYFTEDEGEEEELLLIYKKVLDELDVLVSYNGNGFDFPFLKYRLKRHGLDASFDSILSLDMFPVLNKHSKLRQIIPNLKQKTVEEYMGLRDSRDDVIDGGQSVELFFRYLEYKSEGLRDTMLLHNRDDVLQLSRILWIFDMLDINKVAYHTGFPVISKSESKKTVKMIVTSIKVKTKRIDIQGRYKGVSGRYDIFRDDCTMVMKPEVEQNLIDPESDYGKFEINMPLRYEEKTTFVTRDDVDINDDFWTMPGVDNKDYAILRMDGEVSYGISAIFAKSLIKDILNMI